MEDFSVIDNTYPADSIRFPPFPKPPPGVTIISFNDFQVHGIQVRYDNDSSEAPEIDGLGIHTIKLRVKHQTDEINAGTKTKKRKKRKTGSVTNGVDVEKMEWWEAWEDSEGSRVVQQTYDM
jgi:hypothetical protein